MCQALNQLLGLTERHRFLKTFAVANVWLGQRIFLAQTGQARAQSGSEHDAILGSLLQDFASNNEPLIQLVRVLVLLLSLGIVVPILRGQTRYPRWMVVFNPIVLLGAVFAAYFVAPAVGVYLLPAAMNVAHVVFFGLSTWVALRPQPY